MRESVREKIPVTFHNLCDKLVLRLRDQLKTFLFSLSLVRAGIIHKADLWPELLSTT